MWFLALYIFAWLFWRASETLLKQPLDIDDNSIFIKYNISVLSSEEFKRHSSLANLLLAVAYFWTILGVNKPRKQTWMLRSGFIPRQIWKCIRRSELYMTSIIQTAAILSQTQCVDRIKHPCLHNGSNSYWGLGGARGQDISMYCPSLPLPHWCRVTHTFVSELTIIGLYNGLPPDRRQAIISTNDGILLIRTLGKKRHWNSKHNSHIFPRRNRIWKCILRNGGNLSRPHCINIPVS